MWLMGKDSVIVVGAGLAGLTVAKELAKAGMRVRVLDAAERSGGKAGAEDLIAKALEDPAILQSLASAPADGGDGESASDGEE